MREQADQLRELRKEAAKSRERSDERLQSQPKQYSLYYHEYRNTGSHRKNGHGPVKQGMASSESRQHLASDSSKQFPVAESHSQLPTIAN